MVEHIVDAPQTRSRNSRDEVAKLLKESDIRFLRLSFTDIMGTNKNVEVPTSQFAKALDGQVMFDGSSIEGFSTTNGTTTPTDKINPLQYWQTTLSTLTYRTI